MEEIKKMIRKIEGDLKIIKEKLKEIENVYPFSMDSNSETTNWKLVWDGAK